MGKDKKKRVTFSEDLVSERQKHINDLLETKRELENQIKMAAHTKKKKSSSKEKEVALPVIPPLAEEVVCCVPLCSNTSFSNKNKMFFPFPINKKLSKQWVQNVGRKGFDKKGAENLHKNYKVCGDHFESHSFVPKSKQKVLVKDAVPTIFENAFEPEISIHTAPPPAKKSKKSAPAPPPVVEELPLKTLPKRKSAAKNKVITQEDFQFDFDDPEDIPLATLLPPKLSMKKKLIKKSDNASGSKSPKWMYKPNVQIVQEPDTENCNSSGSEYEYEPSVEIDEQDPKDENYQPTEKKKKMGTRKKPKENLPLTMECYYDELSPAQKEAYQNATKIYEECKKKLDELAKMKNAKLVFDNKDIQAYEIDEGLLPGDVQVEGDFQSIPVGKGQVTAAGGKKGSKNARNKQPLPVQATPIAIAPSPSSYKITTIKPQESTSLGGLFSKVNKSNESGTPDSKEVTFNKLAGKTYPSLVVIARPSLKIKEIPQSVVTSERTALDAKVKAVLLYSNANLIEWLIREGLLRSEQYCNVHQDPNGAPAKLKLGMYSDVSKFPHSGGYVWISECCPNKFVSVFYNSIFEGAPHAPSVLVKLMYHWACQTSIANVTSWVKIDNLYLKTFYSYMRCVCTAAVHEKHELIGGPMKKVEVGVISLGTTNVDGNLRQVKVEVLGVFETETTKIRLRAIEPLPESERNQKKRFAKIMEPLKEWVHPDSAICTDFTVDKSAFLALGFKNVFQVSLNDANPPQMNNKNIMEYLRRVVPRMFQNTLSLLSRHIIQQFLDELVWRERFGPTPSRAFESVVKHLCEQTKLETGDTLLNRYFKISINPFSNWQYSNWSASVTGATIQPVVTPASIADKPSGTAAEPVTVVLDDDNEKRGRKRTAEKSPPRTVKKPMFRASAPVDPSEETTCLETYYYGTLPGKTVICPEYSNLNYSCTSCHQCFSSSTQLLTHLQVHSVIQDLNQQDSNPIMCRYCLKTFTSTNALEDHVDELHMKKNIANKCLICQEKCREKQILVKHMQRSHNQSELPYACEYCEFRSSEHKVVVDHFYSEHANVPALQCPFCLKVVYIAEKDDILEKNISFFLTHLQKHQKKSNRKCNRCSLCFINKMLIREHQLKDHGSYKDAENIKPQESSGKLMFKGPATPVTTLISVPKLKISTASTHYKFEKFEGVKLTPGISKDLPCNECEVPLYVEDHFPGIFTCVYCTYTTCCVNAMHEHAKSFHDPTRKDPEYSVAKPTALDTRHYCACGFNSNFGNKLARHTAMCKKNSVYPNEESAEAARIKVGPDTVLDSLGLVSVRKEKEDTLANGDTILVEENSQDSNVEKTRGDAKESDTAKGDNEPKSKEDEETKTSEASELSTVSSAKTIDDLDDDSAQASDKADQTTAGNKEVGGGASTEEEEKTDDGVKSADEVSSAEIPKESEEDSIDDVISTTTSVDQGGQNIEDEESLLQSGEDSNATSTSKPAEISELTADADSSEPGSFKPSTTVDPEDVEGEPKEPYEKETPNASIVETSDNATFEGALISDSATTSEKTTFEDTGVKGSSSAHSKKDEEEDELIKQDMAALQQDLAALSGLEVMETESPPKSVEKMDSQESQDSNTMEVEGEDKGGAPATPSMECDSSNTGDNMLVE